MIQPMTISDSKDAGKHHADDTSSSSCGAETVTIKREAHTPTTDQSEDSGVDVSAVADGHDSSRGAFKRKRLDDSDDGDGCPTEAKFSRTAEGAATSVLRSINMDTSCTPFRPWSCNEESSSEVGLRLFHDIRNVDRILTLTQQRRGGEQSPRLPPPPEPQPLDLTKGHRGTRPPVDSATSTVDAAAVDDENATACRYATPSSATVASFRCSTVAETTAAAGASTATGTTTVAATATGSTAATATTRYSKNMSRARRIEANARERSRVHTISAAFDTLRATIPSYSRNQKLSKLSTIRIASAYILTLSRLLDMDYSAEQDSPSVAECVDNVTGIIHMEGKARKRKDDQ
ncbi:transcription factor ATOH8 isoform X2 [Aphis gossypii]|uniref:transcription factor ATOH8 isoform X2 n=1 Tax=Aphis gossypii TaxID=80765 RepID=UPI0021596CB5|nr:transcription factor ATOH8 isoform X2 [Aphis gossypii]